MELNKEVNMNGYAVYIAEEDNNRFSMHCNGSSYEERMSTSVLNYILRGTNASVNEWLENIPPLKVDDGLNQDVQDCLNWFNKDYDKLSSNQKEVLNNPIPRHTSAKGFVYSVLHNPNKTYVEHVHSF